LWKRIPPSSKKDRQLVAVWDIGKCMWNKDYVCVYPAFQGCEWDGVHKVLLQHLQDKFRQRTIDLVATSFQSVSSSNLAKYLGVSTADALSFALSRGWTVNGDFVAPVPGDDHKVTLGTSANLHSLAEYVVYLETDLSIPSQKSEKAGAKGSSGQPGSSKAAAGKSHGAK